MARPLVRQSRRSGQRGLNSRNTAIHAALNGLYFCVNVIVVWGSGHRIIFVWAPRTVKRGGEIG